jgi:hypothetical protein
MPYQLKDCCYNCEIPLTGENRSADYVVCWRAYAAGGLDGMHVLCDAARARVTPPVTIPRCLENNDK